MLTYVFLAFLVSGQPPVVFPTTAGSEEDARLLLRVFQAEVDADFGTDPGVPIVLVRRVDGR